MKTFIAELMPAYPIYVSLLPDDAREAIGQVHANTSPARAILEKEGFSWRGSVDILMPARYWKLKPTPSGPSARASLFRPCS
jgi:arginine/ornithine N-succinyltransferase beta subunit